MRCARKLAARQHAWRSMGKKFSTSAEVSFYKATTYFSTIKSANLHLKCYY
jgi:hypothetical protein